MEGVLDYYLKKHNITKDMFIGNKLTQITDKLEKQEKLTKACVYVNNSDLKNIKNASHDKNCKFDSKWF